ILLGIGLVGILGNHGGIALLGTIMYMINHAFFKLLLFFGAGAIYMILKEMSLNVIWGFGRHKNKLKIFFLIGVFGITGVPGFNGYTSKTLIHEAIIEAQHLTHSNFFSIAEMIFYIGGAMTVAYMLKLFVAIFVDENKNYYGQYKNQLKKRAQLPMMILSLIIILIGIFPNSIVKALGRSGEILTYRIPTEINFFTYEALISSIIILLFGGFIYLFAVRRALIVKKDNKLIFLNPSYNWFGLEKDLYYPLFMSVFKGISLFFKFIDVLLLNIVNVLIKISTFIGNIDKVILPKLEWDKMIVVIDFKKMDTDINGRIIKKSALAKEKYTSEKENIKNRLVEGKEKINENKEIKNQRLKDIVENYNIKLSSITFSVFLIGFVIVMSYLFIFII
ncbi:MAG: proton-conducting transporter membrane subunit, partial [Bacillota bacterium]|nr:proton-conducting transporter membrane subunit [Bacillota bacterium]